MMMLVSRNTNNTQEVQCVTAAKYLHFNRIVLTPYWIQWRVVSIPGRNYNNSTLCTDFVQRTFFLSNLLTRKNFVQRTAVVERTQIQSIYLCHTQCKLKSTETSLSYGHSFELETQKRYAYFFDHLRKVLSLLLSFLMWWYCTLETYKRLSNLHISVQIIRSHSQT
jgi:hypothetical protein